MSSSQSVPGLPMKGRQVLWEKEMPQHWLLPGVLAWVRLWLAPEEKLKGRGTPQDWLLLGVLAWVRLWLAPEEKLKGRGTPQDWLLLGVLAWVRLWLAPEEKRKGRGKPQDWSLPAVLVWVRLTGVELCGSRQHLALKGRGDRFVDRIVGVAFQACSLPNFVHWYAGGEFP